MSLKSQAKSSRRQFLNRVAVAAACLPISGVVVGTGTARAADAPQLSEDDPMAKALKYTHDASTVKERSNATAVCNTCQHYSGEAGSAWGPCALFQGKQVNAKGWCSAWAQKA
jgi:hypothetical protein